MTAWERDVVLDEDHKQVVGRISVDSVTGACRFLSGSPELEEHVRVCLAHGVHMTASVRMEDGTLGTGSRVVSPDVSYFWIALDGVLGMVGFRLPPERDEGSPNG